MLHVSCCTCVLLLGELCATRVLGVHKQLDGDITSLLQVLDLIESILQSNNVTQIRSLPKAKYDVKVSTAGFEIRSMMQIWQNMEQINDTMGDMEITRGERRSGTDKCYATLLIHALWEGFHMQVMMRSVTGNHVSLTYGGQWDLGHTTLQYLPWPCLCGRSPLLMAMQCCNG